MRRDVGVAVDGMGDTFVAGGRARVDFRADALVFVVAAAAAVRAGSAARF